MSDRVDVEGQIRSETQGAGYDVAIGMSHPQDSFDAAMADIQAGGQQSVSGEVRVVFIPMRYQGPADKFP
jgi:hypothetical protein